MSLDDIVNLQIGRQTTAPTRLGFGIPLIAAYHDVIPDVVAPFKSVDAIKDAGFLVTDPAYRAAQVAFSQNPRPSQVLIGKRTAAFTKTVKLFPKNTKAKFRYSWTVVEPNGTSTLVEYTVQPNDTIPIIVAAFAAIVNPLAQVAAVAAGSPVDNLTITAAAGLLFNLTGLPNAKHLAVKDVTANPGIADDLDAILEADPSTWYALTLDSQSPAEIKAAAAWTEATRKVFLANTSESDIFDSQVSNDLASFLKGSSFARTGILFSASNLQSYSAMGWLGRQLPKDPGSSTWMFKTLAGVLADSFTDGQLAQLIAKRCNYYQTTGGVPITAEGWTGDGGFLDIAHGADWLYARLQEAVFGGLANAEKVPFTEGGLATIKNLMLGVLRRGVKATFLAEDPAPTVTLPKVADVDISDKINRTLDGVEFDATLAGAVHHVKIKGTLKA